ncbi:MAG: hypothetical protein FJW34_14665 [Acidobacteria bacterium]|nr:hypothetical protein [Acidobacteriota bacterium]
MKRLLVIVAAVVLAYLVGYFTHYVGTSGVQQELQDLRRTSQAEIGQLQAHLRLSRLHGQMGLLILEVEQSNFGKARALSTRLFEDLQRELQGIPEGESRQRLENLRQRRDEITADLAVSSPEVGKRLRQMYGELALISGLRSE